MFDFHGVVVLGDARLCPICFCFVGWVFASFSRSNLVSGNVCFVSMVASVPPVAYFLYNSVKKVTKKAPG